MLPALSHPAPATAVGGALVALLLAACVIQPVATPTPTVEPTASPAPTVTATASPTAAPTASPTPMPTATAFAIAPNPDADALFAVRDTCTNPEAGYELDYPEVWWTNTQVGGVPACSWFSPTFYEVPDPNTRPAEIAIEIYLFQGEAILPTDYVSREEGRIDGQPAIRGEAGPAPDAPPEYRAYVYTIQFGPTLEGGPNVIARTDTTMGGDYVLNKAVLDRIMATLQFVGSIQ